MMIDCTLSVQNDFRRTISSETHCNSTYYLFLSPIWPTGFSVLETENSGKIPNTDLVEVRLNEKLDQISNEIDVVVYAEFSSDEA